MKKILKGLFSFVLVFVCVFALSACTTTISKTTVDTSKVETTNGVTTNGGLSAIYDGYLYFINGTKTNDGTSPSGNVRGAICRVRYDQITGTVTDSTYEVIVDDLVGFNNGSLYFFGDFMYYTSPSSDVNYKNNVLYYKTRFMRYDLVNKQKQTIYTTKQNAEKETTTYGYYIVDNSLNLIVYESQNSTITSILVGDEFKTNYVIENVTSCVLSENYGTCVTDGANVDANNYVYYTVGHETYDEYQTGTIVYKTMPNKNSSVCLSNEGLAITLLCVRNGKLLFSYNSMIYAQAITDSATEKLDTNNRNNIISYQTYDNIIFIENSDGSVSILYYGSDAYEIAIVEINGNGVPTTTQITTLSKAEKFSFVTLSTINEVVQEDDPETTEIDETKTETVKYLFYVADNVLYKLEIEREGEYTQYSQPVKLTKSKVSEPAGTIIPEVVGNYIFILANEVGDDDKETGNVYLHKVDITIDENSTEYGKIVYIKE